MKIELQRYKIMDTRFVLDKDADLISMRWSEFRDKFAPSQSRRSILNLRAVREGGFIGLVESGKSVPTNFVFVNRDQSNNIGYILRGDPSFKHRLIEVYKVKSLDWNTRIEELPPIKGVPLYNRRR